MNRYGSRKFILALLALVVSTALVAFKLISDGVFATVVIACVAAYITGNVAQKKTDKTP
jgi:hypothetical protein